MWLMVRPIGNYWSSFQHNAWLYGFVHCIGRLNMLSKTCYKSKCYFFHIIYLVILKLRFNHAFGPYFRNKISIWSLYFFSSQFVHCFGKFDLNLVISVSGIVTTLNGVPRVSSWIFFNFFEFFLLFFWIFFKRIRNMPCVKLSSCHVAMTKWRDRDNATCQYYARCHFLILNLVFVF